jgi:hypothetical protein
MPLATRTPQSTFNTQALVVETATSARLTSRFAIDLIKIQKDEILNGRCLCQRGGHSWRLANLLAEAVFPENNGSREVNFYIL